MEALIDNNFMDAIIDINKKQIFYEGMKYYPVEKNYNLDDVEYLTINLFKKEIIYSVNCIQYNGDCILCCYFTESKMINKVKIDGIYILTNKLVKLTLMYISYDATFKNKNCCESFNDWVEIYKNDFEIVLDE